MKAIKNICVWIAISLVLQFALLIYLNNYYLSGKGNIKSGKIIKLNTVSSKKTVSVKIPENATNISFSNDGDYVSYYVYSILYVVDTQNKNSVVKINMEPNSVESFAKWVDNTDGLDRLYIAEKQLINGSATIRFHYYDTVQKQKYEVTDPVEHRDVAIKLRSKNAKITDLEFNTANTILYAKVSTGEYSTLYRVDKSQPIETLETRTNYISNMQVIKDLDQPIYEGAFDKKVYIYTNRRALSINGVDKYKLLGVDINDNVYIGSLALSKDSKNYLVDKIYYGEAKKTGIDFKSINLSSPVDSSRIYVDYNGRIYVDDELKGNVIEKTSGKKINYEGNMIGVFDRGIIYKKNNIIYIKPVFD